MGSSSSRLEDQSTPSTVRSSLKRRLLSSLFCGASSSSSSSPSPPPPIEIGDHPHQSSPAAFHNFSSSRDLPLTPKHHSSSSSTSALGTSDDASASVRLSFSNHSELHSQQLNVDDSVMEASVVATPLKCHPSMDSPSADAPHSSLANQDANNLLPLAESVGDSSRGRDAADSSSNISDSLVPSQPLPSFFLSVGEQGSIGMGLLLVDVVSIHSNTLSSSIAEITNREARRNTRRMFWDAFSRNSFRRNSDSPTIVFSTSHADDLGSHDRWLLDHSGDLHYDGVVRESRYSTTRTNHRGGHRWPSRYEMSERFHDVDEQGWQSSLCTSGLHPRGTCSCESSFTAEESRSRANISQIIMLADALFEVLEEIHRHRMSVSLSTVTLPAPEAVVNSFPIKNHNPCSTERGTHDALQCHICLVDYEEGDEIRVLPCSHEYHMSCVDKWLIEIHGVCPLCREDVCKGVTEGSASNPEIPSL